MRPTEPGSFRDAEVFDFPETDSKLGNKDGELPAGRVEGIARGIMQGGVHGESKKTIGSGAFRAVSESGDLASSAPPARPLTTGKDQNEALVVIDVVSESGLRVRANGLLV
jgi:hypothetical protein